MNKLGEIVLVTSYIYKVDLPSFSCVHVIREVRVFRATWQSKKIQQNKLFVLLFGFVSYFFLRPNILCVFEHKPKLNIYNHAVSFLCEVRLTSCKAVTP